MFPSSFSYPWRRLKDIWWRFWRKNQLGERLWLLFRLILLLFSPSYAKARRAVRETAVTPHMRDKQTWGMFWSTHSSQPGLQENLSRHLLATDKFGPVPFALRHLRNVSLELAYFALKERGK